LGATHKLYTLLDHEERAIQRNATMAFGILSSNVNVRKALRQNQDCLNKMILFLSSEYDPLTNEYAAMWLKNMCEDYSTKTIVANSQGALSSLITMLNATDPDSIFNTLGTIDKLMSDYQPRQMIREHKGIEPILNLNRSEYPQIQELVFSILTKATQNGNLK
jgi:hypothetical protein